MSLYSVGPLLGPIIGPVAGGFLGAAKGWRWIFWLLVMIAGCIACTMLFFMKETYASVILQRRTDRLQQETGNTLLRSKLDTGLPPRDYFARSIIRPQRMLLRSPIVALFTIYIAVVYGYLYLMFTSITEVFQQHYGFNSDVIGLVFLGLGVGSMMGLVIFSTTSDRHVKRHALRDSHEGLLQPEYRLQLLPVGAIILPAGLLLYGWTAEYRVHWMVPIIAMAVIGTGNILIFLAMQLSDPQRSELKHNAGMRLTMNI